MYKLYNNHLCTAKNIDLHPQAKTTPENIGKHQVSDLLCLLLRFLEKHVHLLTSFKSLLTFGKLAIPTTEKSCTRS